MNSKKKISYSYLLLSLALYLICSIPYFMINKTSSFVSNITFLIYVVSNLFFVTNLIIFTQKVSIIFVNKAAEEWEEKPCKYCCNDKSKLVCQECDSIQWNLKSKNLLYTSIAIFLAHHRWKIINTALTFFLIGPLLFAVKFHFEEINHINAKSDKINSEIQNIIRLSNNVRPKLINLKIMLEENTVTDKRLLEEREYLLQNYYEYAWELAEVTDYLKHSNMSTERHDAYEEAIQLIKKANLIPEMDNILFNVVNSITDFKKDGTTCSKKYLCKTIDSLDTFTKGISCAIGEISFNPDISHRRDRKEGKNEKSEIIDGSFNHINKLNKLLERIKDKRFVLRNKREITE